MKQSVTVIVAMVLGACGGGGGGGGGDDVGGGDDTGGGGEYEAFVSTCEAAREAYWDLGCSASPEDLCDRDVQWLQMTGDTCYDELLGWWQCLSAQFECDHECDPSPSVDCVADFCTANPDNSACTGCIQGCPP